MPTKNSLSALTIAVRPFAFCREILFFCTDVHRFDIDDSLEFILTQVIEIENCWKYPSRFVVVIDPTGELI